MTASPTTPLAATGPTETAALWEDFIDIFYAPRAVFERRRDGRFWPALVVLTVVLTVLFWVMQTALAPIFEAEFARGMEAARQANPQITEAQIQQTRSMGAVFGLVGFALTFPVTILLVGLVLWLVGKLFDGAQTLGAAFMVSTYAQFPRVLDMALKNVEGYLADPGRLTGKYSVGLNLARFLDRATTSPVLYELAGRVDVFTLWVTALLGLGLHVTGRVPMRQAWIAAALVWLVGALPAVLGALRAG